MIIGIKKEKKKKKVKLLATIKMGNENRYPKVAACENQKKNKTN